jgi:hypothetical protein
VQCLHQLPKHIETKKGCFRFSFASLPTSFDILKKRISGLDGKLTHRHFEDEGDPFGKEFLNSLFACKAGDVSDLRKPLETARFGIPLVSAERFGPPLSLHCSRQRETKPAADASDSGDFAGEKPSVLQPGFDLQARAGTLGFAKWAAAPVPVGA